MPSAAESPTFLIPETHAAMTAYILAPGRANGLYAAVDIGAGTTDVSFFWCGRENGIPKAWYYSAKSDFIGVDDLDRVVISRVGGTLGDVRSRRSETDDALRRWPDEVAAVLHRVYEQYRRTFGQAFGKDRGDRTWVREVRDHKVTDEEILRGGWGHPGGVEYSGRSVTKRRAKFTLCLVGGGARLRCISAALARPLDYLRFDEIPVEVPELPEDLRMLQDAGRTVQPPNACSGELPLMLLAYGLAHRAVDIPEWAEHQPVTRPIQYRPEVTHEDLYG